MNSSDEPDDRSAKRFAIAKSVERLGHRMYLLGFLGLGCGWVYRWLGGLSEDEQRESTLGAILVHGFSGLFIIGLLVVLPSSAFFYRRAQRLNSTSTPPAGPPTWQLPAWLGWPLWAITTIGALLLIFALLRYVVEDLLGR